MEHSEALEQWSDFPAARADERRLVQPGLGRLAAFQGSLLHGVLPPPSWPSERRSCRKAGPAAAAAAGSGDSVERAESGDAGDGGDGGSEAHRGSGRLEPREGSSAEQLVHRAVADISAAGARAAEQEPRITLMVAFYGGDLSAPSEVGPGPLREAPWALAGAGRQGRGLPLWAEEMQPVKVGASDWGAAAAERERAVPCSPISPAWVAVANDEPAALVGAAGKEHRRASRAEAEEGATAAKRRALTRRDDCGADGAGSAGCSDEGSSDGEDRITAAQQRVAGGVVDGGGEPAPCLRYFLRTASDFEVLYTS